MAKEKKPRQNKVFILKDVFVRSEMDGGKIPRAKRGECLRWFGNGNTGFVEGGKRYIENGYSPNFGLLQDSTAWKCTFLAPYDSFVGPFDEEEGGKLYLLTDPSAVWRSDDIVLVSPMTGRTTTISPQQVLEMLEGKHEDAEEALFAIESDNVSRYYA